MRRASLIVLLFGAFFASCFKAGEGGKGSVSVHVFHNGNPVANALVHIKYGSKESPGETAADYDRTDTCDALGQVVFGPLRRGKYFVFAEGETDSLVAGEGSTNLPRRDADRAIIIHATSKK